MWGLEGGTQTPCCGLFDVDVGGGGIFVFVDGERDGCVGDCFAEEPGYALLWEGRGG